MLQNTSETLGFQKIMVYKTPRGGGGGKLYLARGLLAIGLILSKLAQIYLLFNHWSWLSYGDLDPIIKVKPSLQMVKFT